MRAVWALALASFAGCSSAGALDESCLARTAEPMVHGALEETYLGLDETEARAIVQVSGGTKQDSPLCSGVFVNQSWVLTAAHCLVIDDAEVLVRTSGGGSLPAKVVDRVRHPSTDVALLQVVLETGSSPDFEPLAIAGATDDAATRSPTAGEVVAIAGYGLTEHGDARELRFLAEPIVATEAATVRVSGYGANGACAGDSGGPLLVRARDGSVAVLGVLSTGSTSCREEDRYVRVDVIRDWVLGVAGPTGGARSACGKIDRVGRCLYGSAVYCAGTELTGDPCDGGTECGWDRVEGGFRCVEPRTDPCGGVDSVGRCGDSGALRCSAGRLQLEPCSCSESCFVEGATGRPSCR
jgi:hypothetical protein